MSTSIVNASRVDSVLTELLTVGAVTTAFPVTTLSGGVAGRYKTVLATLRTTPANAQVKDEQGDVLSLHFLSTAGEKVFTTQKGLRRLEIETSDTTL